MTRFNACLVCGLVIGAARPLLAETSMNSALYQCDRDVMISASYINTADESIAVISADGWEHMVLVNVPAASGARYEAPKGEAVKDLWSAPYVWWTKGHEATLYHLDDEAKETILLSCLAAP